MKKLLIILPLTILVSCSTAKSGAPEINTDATYGYSEKNPIKVGGDSNGPANEQKFLNSLTGPNGEALEYSRSGSCCHFETMNSSFGMGMLDIYRVTYVGKKDTVKLYINIYDKAKLKAPVGFKFK